MFVPLLAVPLAVQMIAAAEGVPKLDVTASCRGAAEAGYVTTTQERLQNCIDSEHRTRDQLDKNWASFPASCPRVLPRIDRALRADLHRTCDLPGDAARPREPQDRPQPAPPTADGARRASARRVAVSPGSIP